MLNDINPLYLSSLVPPLVQNASRYNIRNYNDTQTVASRTTLFYNSFLLSSVRDWNRLNPDIRNNGTLDAFNYKLNQNLPVIPKQYYSGIRKYQIWHTRIRTGCSSLKNELFLKILLTFHYVLAIKEKLRMPTISFLFVNYTIILGYNFVNQ